MPKIKITIQCDADLLEGSCMKEIPLSKGFFAVVDDEDYNRVSQFKWHAVVHRNLVYAFSHHYSGIHVSMHSFIIGLKRGLEIDHIDGNGLNNSKLNLRHVTRRQNCQNLHPASYKKVSKYPGISFHTKTGRWYGRARFGPKAKMTKNTRYYLTEDEANAELQIILKEICL